MKSIFNYFIFSIFAVGLFSSCISSEEMNYMQNITLNYPIKPFEEYKLSVDDKISCNISSSDTELVGIFNTVLSPNQSAAKTYIIYSDSTVILPFFGRIKIAGLTIQEAERVIQKMMQESVKDAQVKVTLASNNFYILASNKRNYPSVYKDNMTIYQALAVAQQTTSSMDISKISILRRDASGKTITKTFDLRSQDLVQSEFYYIKPNDLIYIPTNKRSFFNIESLGAFTSAMMIPLTFLVYTVLYNYNDL